MLSNRQRLVRNDVEPRRLAVRLLEPEYLGERDCLAVTLVAEAPENDRIVVVVPERHRLRRQPRLAALRLVMTEHVGPQIAFAHVRAGRLVECDLLGRDQQARDGIDERRLARADVAGQERVVTAEVEAPDLPVEGAPVQDLDGVEAHARRRTIRLAHKIERE